LSIGKSAHSLARRACTIPASGAYEDVDRSAVQRAYSTVVRLDGDTRNAESPFAPCRAWGRRPSHFLVLVTASAAADESTAAEYFASEASTTATGYRRRPLLPASARAWPAQTAGDTLTILPGHLTSKRFRPGFPERPQRRSSSGPPRPSTVLIRGDVDAPRFRPAEGRLFTFCADFEKRVEGVAERSTLRIYEPMLSLA